MMERSTFLRILTSFLGFAPAVTVISCQKENGPTAENENKDAAYALKKENTRNSGFYRENNDLWIDVSHPKYAVLAALEGHINDEENFLLLLRTSTSEIKAFNHCCPHLGTTNQWQYSNGRFRCQNHGNSYGLSGGNIARCGSGRTNGNLRQYTTALDRDILHINLA